MTNVLFIIILSMLGGSISLITTPNHKITRSAKIFARITSNRELSNIPSWNRRYANFLRSSDKDGLELAVTHFMHNWNISGLTLALARNGRLAYANGFGYAIRPENWDSRGLEGGNSPENSCRHGTQDAAQVVSQRPPRASRSISSPKPDSFRSTSSCSGPLVCSVCRLCTGVTSHAYACVICCSTQRAGGPVRAETDHPIFETGSFQQTRLLCSGLTLDLKNLLRKLWRDSVKNYGHLINF